jgi:hypothetical protein
MGAETLVRVLIIDVYFPDFGGLLRARTELDPVEDFRTYVAVRDSVRRGVPPDPGHLDAAFGSRGLAVPAAAEGPEILDQLEREVPPSFPKLAQNPDFLTLLDGLGDVEALREKLRRYTATTVRQRGPEGTVYLSYRRRDSSRYAGRIQDTLIERFGRDRVFADVATIEAGADFRQVIESAVASADVVLAIIGAAWSDPQLLEPDDFVRQELAFALARPGARVIPVLVGGATMPGPTELPPDLAPLYRRNALELSDDRWDHDVGRLLEVIEYSFASGEERAAVPVAVA